MNLPVSDEAIRFAKTNRGLTWNEDQILIGTRTDFAKREASLSVGGVDIVKVGFHYDVVIGDDYHSEKNVTSAEQIQKVVQHIQLMTSILDPGAQYVVIGTRWDDKDAYGWIIEEIEGLRIKKPGVYKGKFFDIMVYPWRIGEPQPGEEFDPNVLLTHPKTGAKYPGVYKSCTYFAPQILNEVTIVPLKALHSPYSFSCQYMNDPIDAETAVFKESWIKNNIISQARIRELWDEMVIFTSVDPAVTETADIDYSAIVTVGFACPTNDEGHPTPMRILLDAHYGRWNPDKLVSEVFDVYRTFRPVQVGFESVAGFDAYQSVFRESGRRKSVYIPINFFKRDTKISKEARIRALSPMFQAGGFHMVRGARGIDEFWEEYRRYPRAKHDDVLDALADLEKFGYFPNVGGGRQLSPDYQPLDQITGY